MRGLQRERAARMAVDAVNGDPSLLAGHTLAMVVRDTEATASVGAAVAADLIENEGVVALVGASSSSVSAAIADVATAAGRKSHER